ncbi:hypothetical protein CDCA_CDCA07G2137 [Cyanidium caldarium]|uniref:Uncharacterized protein n=1 Tax=Cyanidium caldarium TaxID=2771 RepID=A0AAV9IUV2_CYACA|nr:hypothetical protein CDCA_CDCA07G2137 [Cyanidium caldarium]
MRKKAQVRLSPVGEAGAASADASRAITLRSGRTAPEKRGNSGCAGRPSVGTRPPASRRGDRVCEGRRGAASLGASGVRWCGIALRRLGGFGCCGRQSCLFFSLFPHALGKAMSRSRGRLSATASIPWKRASPPPDSAEDESLESGVALSKRLRLSECSPDVEGSSAAGGEDNGLGVPSLDAALASPYAAVNRLLAQMHGERLARRNAP